MAILRRTYRVVLIGATGVPFKTKSFYMDGKSASNKEVIRNKNRKDG